MAQKGFEKLLSLYQQRLNDAEEIYRDKRERIRDARRAYKQIMSNDSYAKMSSADPLVGNDYDRTEEQTKSRFLYPIFTGVAEKMIAEMQTNPYRFEWEDLDDGPDISDAFTKELLKIYSLKNNNVERNVAFWHYVVSGVSITQTYTENLVNERILPDGETQKINQGRTIGFQAYDPLSVFVDWNANPSRVSETAEWCIVTIGEFDSAYIENKYGIEVQGSFSVQQDADTHKQVLNLDAGVDKKEMIPVREYYLRDGYRYLVVNDSHVVERSVNSNGTYGRIPLNFASLFFDPESSYGFTLYEMLEPSIEVISTSINQIADVNALNARMPIFYAEGILPTSGISLDELNPNSMIPLKIDKFLMASSNRPVNINDLISKLQFPDLSQSALFLYEKAFEAIWYITGLNPTTLGGIQSKQIRSSNVMDTINQAALRNSSKPVLNIESGFMNPTSLDIARIFEMYYDDFPSFKEAGITKEFLANLKNLRVVNGSFLPGDNMSEEQKMAVVYQLAMNNPNVYDLDKVERKMLKSKGIRNVNAIFRDPLEFLDEQQLMQMYTILQGNNALQQLNQLVETGLQEKGMAPQ